MREFTTVASMKLATLTEGQTVTTQGYYAVDDGGAGTYLIAATQSVDGQKDHSLFGGTVALLKESQHINVKQFGAKVDGVTNDTTAVVAAHTYALSVGIRKVYVPAGNCIVDSTAKIADVIWVGEGTFVGPLRDRVHRETDALSTPVLRTLNGGNHLGKMAAAPDPVVVLIGDSISTEDPTISLTRTDTFWGMLQNAIKLNNPEKNFTFHNRAIGAATFTSCNPVTLLSATGLTLPSWAGAGSSPWLDYVEALSPDLIIFAFGMNDRQNFVTAQFRAIMGAVSTWAKVPSVVFSTPMTPSRMAPDASIGDPDSQEGRDFVATYIRSYCEYHGYGYIDINHTYNALKDGFDVRSLDFTKTTSSAVTEALPYTHTDSYVGGYGAQLEFVANVPAGLFTQGLRFDTSLRGVNSESFLEILDNGGFLEIKLVEIDDGPGRYFSLVTSTATPSTNGSLKIKVFIEDCKVYVFFNDVEVLNSNIIRHGGQFNPTIEAIDGSTPTMQLLFWEGQYTPTMPLIMDREMWGDGSTGLTGGNDKNHPTSYGASVIYTPVIYGQGWYTTPFTTVGNKVGVRATAPSGFLHITKQDSLSSTANSDSNNLVLEDDTDAGISFLTNNNGAARINFGDPEDKDVGQINYVHSTDTFNIKAGATTIVSATGAVFNVPVPFHTAVGDGVTGALAGLRDMHFDLVSNTQLRIYVRGNDNTVRSVTLTLA